MSHREAAVWRSVWKPAQLTPALVAAALYQRYSGRSLIGPPSAVKM
jgi:hypothetical protein